MNVELRSLHVPAAPLSALCCPPTDLQQQGEGKKKETKLGLTASKTGDFGEW